LANIERALKIPGFMSHAEISWLAFQATTRQRIVEVGSLVGRSTCALADNTPGFVLAVDDCKGPRDCTMSWKERQSIPQQFQDNLKDHIASGKVIPWKTDHATIDMKDCPVTDGKPFDFCFIDGDHKAASVKRDLDFWVPKIAEGGLICGHDYDVSYPGVLESTSNVFGDKVGTIPNTTIWFYVVPVVIGRAA
jgi:predicted O-methyltransferase YrrM